MGLAGTHIATYKIDKQQDPTVYIAQELYSIFCNKPLWKRLGKNLCVCLCVYLNHCGIHRKLTHHHTSAILQLKKNESSPFVYIVYVWGQGSVEGP